MGTSQALKRERRTQGVTIPASTHQEEHSNSNAAQLEQLGIELMMNATSTSLVDLAATAYGPAQNREQGTAQATDQGLAWSLDLGTDEGRDPADLRSDISRFTPEFVAKNRDALGIPPGAPISDFFVEFIAHQRIGTAGKASNRRAEIADMPEGTEEERYAKMAAQELLEREDSLMRSWGYDPQTTVDQEVHNEETGLYVARFDPSQEGYDPKYHEYLKDDPLYRNGMQSISAFRGTQLFEGFGDHSPGHAKGIDLLTDLDPTHVGERQYDASKTEIGALIRGGVGADRGEGVLTGHSLGGFLAQRAAVEQSDSLANLDGVVSNVVTFQSGGLDAETAANLDTDQVACRHHTAHGTDFVHLAGEQKTAGTHFAHVAKSGFNHTNGLMFGSEGPGALGLSVMRDKLGTCESEIDPVAPWNRHLIEGGRQMLGLGANLVDTATLHARAGLGLMGFHDYNAVDAGRFAAYNRPHQRLASVGEHLLGALSHSTSAVLSLAGPSFPIEGAELQQDDNLPSVTDLLEPPLREQPPE